MALRGSGFPGLEGLGNRKAYRVFDFRVRGFGVLGFIVLQLQANDFLAKGVEGEGLWGLRDTGLGVLRIVFVFFVGVGGVGGAGGGGGGGGGGNAVYGVQVNVLRAGGRQQTLTRRLDIGWDWTPLIFAPFCEWSFKSFLPSNPKPLIPLKP